MSVQVPKGYKQTEVGVIPEDWECLGLGEVLKSTQLGGNYKNTLNPTNFPLIKMGNLGRGFINLEKIEYIPANEYPKDSDKLKFGDVLFNTRNTPELVGKVAIWRDELPFAYFNSNLMRLNFDDKKVSSKFFMNIVLNTTQVIEKLKGIATGTTSVAAIYNRDLIKVAIPLPSKKEQQAIAETLSDADALIESVEQLIAKKRQIKQGAMQELLTGQRRLPGFSGEWELKRLGEIANIAKGQLITERTITPGDIPVIAGGKKPAYFHNAANRTGKTITISGSGASAGYVAFYRSPIFASDCSTIEEAKNYDINFIYFVLLLNQETIYKAQTGGAQPHIHPDDLRPLMINFPMDLSEQTAIATFIGDMEAEIFALESRLDKARQIKQSMMQELLTGRIRLI